jgi:AcrR family transcriptional regulator
MPRARDSRPGTTPPTPVRDRILDGALALLQEGGIRQLTQMRVAARARVRQSHVTYYFPTRHHLVEATTTRFVDTLAAGLATLVARPTRGGMTEALHHLAQVIGEDSHMRMFLGLIVATDDDADLRAILVGGTQRLEAALAALLGDGHRLDRARAMLAAMWGLGLYRHAIRPAARNDPTRRVLDLLAAGFAREAEPERPTDRPAPQTLNRKVNSKTRS